MEWFKFRTCWKAPIMMLSDEEAGRVIKALLTYVDSEEEQKTGDKGDILLCLMTGTLKEDLCLFRQNAEKKERLRKVRSDAGRKGAIAKHAKESLACK
ncbi:MAG: hypothetical protein IKG87_14130 [Clostridia bacterium]|nr:hypothetical protein [Clostridia bacterium]